MEVVLYEEKEHLHLIRDWLVAREIDPSTSDGLPAVGFVALFDGNAIAAGFLRSCEGYTAIVDGFCTNGSILGILRTEALDLITSKLISHARAMNLKQLIAYTVDTHTIERGKKHGFKVTPHTLLALKLGD